MKNSTKNLITGCAFMLSLLFVNITNAQTQKPDLNIVTPIVKGFVIKYDIKVGSNDTVESRIELAATNSFVNPQAFKIRFSDTNTSYVDTLTEAMGLSPAPATYFIRIVTVSRKRLDSLSSSVEQKTTLETVQNCTLKIVQVLPHQSGCYFTFNVFSGNATEKMTVVKKYSYDSVNFFPAGTRIFTGKVSGTQDSVYGLFGNKTVFIRLFYSNTKNSKDTTIRIKTVLESQKPVIEITSVTAGINQVEIKGMITTFGLKTSLTSTVGNQIMSDTFQSLKSEPFSFVVKNLPDNTSVTGLLKAINAKGSATESWSSKTLPAPIEPKLTVTKVAFNNGSLVMDWSWFTNSDNLFTRVDAKIYADSNETIPVEINQISSGSPKQSGSSTFNLSIDTGTYWVRLTGEVQKGTYPKSNIYKFTLSQKLGVESITKITERVDVQVYNAVGQLLGTFPFSNSDYSQLPDGIIFVHYVDLVTGQIYKGKICK